MPAASSKPPGTPATKAAACHVEIAAAIPSAPEPFSRHTNGTMSAVSSISSFGEDGAGDDSSLGGTPTLAAGGADRAQGVDSSEELTTPRLQLGSHPERSTSAATSPAFFPGMPPRPRSLQRSCTTREAGSLTRVSAPLDRPLPSTASGPLITTPYSPAGHASADNAAHDAQLPVFPSHHHLPPVQPYLLQAQIFASQQGVAAPRHRVTDSCGPRHGNQNDPEPLPKLAKTISALGFSPEALPEAASPGSSGQQQPVGTNVDTPFVQHGALAGTDYGLDDPSCSFSTRLLQPAATAPSGQHHGAHGHIFPAASGPSQSMSAGGAGMQAGSGPYFVACSASFTSLSMGGSPMQLGAGAGGGTTGVGPSTSQQPGARVSHSTAPGAPPLMLAQMQPAQAQQSQSPHASGVSFTGAPGAGVLASISGTPVHSTTSAQSAALNAALAGQGQGGLHTLGSSRQHQGLWQYLRAEVAPAEKQPTADVVWGQTERERVYNFLMYVPFHLERLITFGFLMLNDSFLAVLTMLPFRCALALGSLALACVPGRGSSHAKQPAAGAASPGHGSGYGNRRSVLSGSQLYDLLCVAMLAAAVVCLRAVRPGAIYYWLKDITSEFLKMSVLSTAFDMSDKILSNFGVDVLEALSGTCTQWVAGKARTMQLASDVLVAGGVVVLHALTLMCQGLVLAVAMTSRRGGVLALLIANNFVEVKSSVFKKWDTTRIWSLVCQDMVERFHLVLVLTFVVVEEMESSASWAPPADYLAVCGLMVASEVVIDVVKHAVLGKFNDIRPGIYREFHQELCERAVDAQSHSTPRLLAFHVMAPAALALRIALTLLWLRVETKRQLVLRMVFVVAPLWAVLFGLKVLAGHGIKSLARWHLRTYGKRQQKHGHARPSVIRQVAGTVADQQQQQAAAAAAAAPLPGRKHAKDD